ncbi:MAG: DUF4112 domain-containing protein [Acidobacteria bacterium]|nr:DUF4112 domain-containing protein [Acidobacteriota bacterium]
MNDLDSSIETREKGFDRKVKRVEGAELEHLERMARWLDDLIRIPFLNIRIGLDPILGAVPWLGDTATAVFSIYLIGSAIFYSVPKIIILRMAVNVGLDYLLGIIPFVGDATDFFIKSNRWNMNLLRRYARERRKPGLSEYFFVGGVIAALVLLIVGGVALVLYSLKTVGNLW